MQESQRNGLINLSNVLAGRNVDYIVISHLEPDHAANIKALSDKYPDAKLVLSAKAKAMLSSVLCYW